MNKHRQMSEQMIKGFVTVDYDPFAKGEFEASASAIEPQMEIIASCLIGGDDANRSYNESNSLRLTGPFHQAAMKNALQELVIRHEALRACFNEDGSFLFIHKEIDLHIEFEDLTKKTATEQESFIQDFRLRNARTPFDLLNGPLFRVALLKLADDDHYLTLTAHHIICDGWSFGILLEELGQLYSAYAKNEVPHLPVAPSFITYALEQKKFYKSAQYRKIEQYWIDQYKNDIPVLDLPTDFPRPSLRTYTAQRLDLKLPEDTTTALKKLGAKAGCSFVTTLLTAFELFVHKLSGQDKIIIGLPAAGQPATGYNGLVGHCVNLLPLCSELTGKMSFTDFLKKQRSAVLDAYDHQLFTFGSLLQKLPVPRDASRVPMVPVVFNIDMGMDNKVSFHGLRYEKISNPRVFENFDVFLNVNGSAQSLTFEWCYNTQLFKQATIRQWMKAFEHMLNEIITNPVQPLEDLSLNNQQEIIDVLNKLNDTAAAYPKNVPLHQLIGQQANMHPEKIAIAYNNEKLTYRELNEWSNQLAGSLIQSGVNPGDTVGLLMDRSHKLVVTLLAIMKTGAAYLPIDPAYPLERVHFMLNDASAKLLLIAEKYKSQFSSSVKKITIEDLWKGKSSLPKKDLAKSVDSRQLVYLLYTSGSTGKPKGVRIRHYNLVNFLFSMQNTLALTAQDKLLAITTISFDISCLELYLPLLSGARLHIVDTETAKDGRLLMEVIKQQKPTIMQATPSTWQMLLEVGWPEKTTINTICCGGEALPISLADELQRRCTSLYNLYGPTETTVWSSVKKVTFADEVITIGRPISNTQIYILDSNGKPVPQNTVGEIYIAGDGVADGYLNRDELTSEKFISDPFSGTGGLMYRTGDLGKLLPDGDIQCLGRVDQQVKIRGFRIELEEIEACLEKQALVSRAVVIAREGQQGYQSLAAYVVVNPEAGDKTSTSPTATEMINQWKHELSKELPGYMVPNDVVILEKLPTTPNGKIDKKALHQAYTAPSTTVESHEVRTPQEEIIATIWTAVLGIKDIGVNDNFFDLGGHSLLAVKMMGQIEKQTGVRLPLGTLYEHTTVKKLAAKLQASTRPKNEDCLVTIKPTGSKTPLYFIHGAHGDVFCLYSLAKYMHPDQPIYGIRSSELSENGAMKETIEEIAAEYVSLIVHQNPSGPYILVGYCFGGFVAFEMAKQLQKMGKEVKKLLIIDGIASPVLEFNSVIEKQLYHLKEFFRRKWYDISYFIKDPTWKIYYEKSRLMTPLVKYKRKIFGEKNDPLLMTFKLESKSITAMNNYQLSPYDGTLHLLRSEKRVSYTPDMTFFGWKPYARKGVKTYDVPGIHDQIFFEPNVPKTAQVLQYCLDNNVPELDTSTNIVSVNNRESYQLETTLSMQ